MAYGHSYSLSVKATTMRLKKDAVLHVGLSPFLFCEDSIQFLSLALPEVGTKLKFLAALYVILKYRTVVKVW